MLGPGGLFMATTRALGNQLWGNCQGMTILGFANWLGYLYAPCNVSIGIHICICILLVYTVYIPNEMPTQVHANEMHEMCRKYACICSCKPNASVQYTLTKYTRVFFMQTMMYIQSRRLTSLVHTHVSFMSASSVFHAQQPISWVLSDTFHVMQMSHMCVIKLKLSCTVLSWNTLDLCIHINKLPTKLFITTSNIILIFHIT